MPKLNFQTRNRNISSTNIREEMLTTIFSSFFFQIRKLSTRFSKHNKKKKYNRQFVQEKKENHFNGIWEKRREKNQQKIKLNNIKRFREWRLMLLIVLTFAFNWFFSLHLLVSVSVSVSMFSVGCVSYLFFLFDKRLKLGWNETHTQSKNGFSA